MHNNMYGVNPCKANNIAPGLTKVRWGAEQGLVASASRLRQKGAPWRDSCATESLQLCSLVLCACNQVNQDDGLVIRDESSRWPSDQMNQVDGLVIRDGQFLQDF